MTSECRRPAEANLWVRAGHHQVTRIRLALEGVVQCYADVTLRTPLRTSSPSDHPHGIAFIRLFEREASEPRMGVSTVENSQVRRVVSVNHAGRCPVVGETQMRRRSVRRHGMGSRQPSSRLVLQRGAHDRLARRSDDPDWHGCSHRCPSTGGHHDFRSHDLRTAEHSRRSRGYGDPHVNPAIAAPADTRLAATKVSGAGRSRAWRMS